MSTPTLNEQQTIVRGRVKWFNHVKGYGFIATDGRDVFVHYKQLENAPVAVHPRTGAHCKTLVPGTQVDFTIETDETGRAKAYAVNVVEE